jgi:spermidine synthase
MDLEMLRVIIRTFLHVYPRASAYLAHYSLQTPMLALVGAEAPVVFPDDWYARRVTDSGLLQSLEEVRLRSFYSLFGCLVARSEDLIRFSGDGPINTDDRPVVAFGAPRFVYSKQDPPWVRLFALLDRFEPRTDHVLGVAETDEERRAHDRLAAYWLARDRFLRAGVGVEPTEDVREMLGRVRAPLLQILRLSPDFDAAYDPLLAMASQLARTDPDGARQLLSDLERANSARR